MEGTEKSHRTVKRYLQTLKILNLIEFQGAAKTGKYYLNKENKVENKVRNNPCRILPDSICQNLNIACLSSNYNNYDLPATTHQV
jgi:hypothetical protein